MLSELCISVVVVGVLDGVELCGLLEEEELYPPLAARLLSALQTARSPALTADSLLCMTKLLLRLTSAKLHINTDLAAIPQQLLLQSNIIKLDMARNIRINSLQPITLLRHNLKAISLEWCKKIDDQACTQLAQLDLLEHLNLNGTLISDLTLQLVGNALHKLRVLAIRSCTKLAHGIQYVTHLPLEKLYISETKLTPQSLNSIKQCAQTLQVLEMSFMIHLKDEDTLFLESLGRLEELDISFAHLLGDLTIIRAAGLPNLRRLNASKIDAPSPTAMEALSKNTSLKELDLSKNDLSDVSAARLVGLCQLEAIYLSYTRITDQLFMIAPEIFSCAKQLKLTGLLGLTDQGVARLSVIAPQVEILDIGSRQLSDNCLEHLSSMSRLRELRIWDTRVSEECAAHFCAREHYKVSDDMRSTRGTYILLRANK
jgi:Leucine-rich repeat (LRR) protein